MPAPCLLCLQCRCSQKQYPQNIDQWRREDNAVKPVHNSAVPRDQISVVLEKCIRSAIRQAEAYVTTGVTAQIAEPMSPPAAPSIVFLGLRTGAILCLPNSIPAASAQVSQIELHTKISAYIKIP